jgi:transposase
VPRLGKQKTIVAVEHSTLIAAWHILTDNVDYHDLGGDYFTKQDPQRVLRRITRDANRLGYTVRFDSIQAA